MNSPKTIQWTKITLGINILFCLAVVYLFIWMVGFEPTSEFARGVKAGFTQKFPFYNYEVAGKLSAMPVLNIIISILVLIGITKKTKGWGIASLVMLGFMILLSCANFGFPIFTIAAFVLLLLKPSRVYMNLAAQNSSV